MASPSSVLCFARICGALKTIKRTGWVNNEIALPESVADHMYRMSMLAFMIQDPNINKDRLIKICLVHDLAEAIVGDITPFDVNINATQKQELEIEGVRMIVKAIVGDDADLSSGANNALAKEIVDLWCEYEGVAATVVLTPAASAGAESAGDAAVSTGDKKYTAESSLAHQLDKLEMIIQADEYERVRCAAAVAQGTEPLHPHHLQSFFNSTCFTNGIFDEDKGVFKHPEMRAWVKELVEQRSARALLQPSQHLRAEGELTDKPLI